MSADYTITVSVANTGPDDPRRPPSMAGLLDAVCGELERLGYSDRDYNVEVHGPPELRIGVRP